MKKKLIILLLILLIILIVPVNVFASGTDLISNELFYQLDNLSWVSGNTYNFIYSSPQVTYTQLTDNNLATQISVNSSIPPKYVVTGDLGGITISRMSLTADNNNFQISFYNELKQKIAYVNYMILDGSTVDLVQGQNITFNIGNVLENIHYISISNQGSSYGSIRDLKFYNTNEIDTTPPAEITNLQHTKTDTSINLTFNNPIDTDFSHTNIYLDGVYQGQTTNGSYSITDLIPETQYLIKITTLDNILNESIGTLLYVTTNLEFQPLAEVSNLTIEPNVTTAYLTYLRPIDSRFNHVKIYYKEVSSTEYVYSGMTYNSYYTITGLQSDTTYNTKVTVVDNDLLESEGIEGQFTTLEEDLIPPDTPTNIVIYELNAGLRITYDKNLESDLLGYNIYLDGIKHNNQPITSLYYTILSLTNGQQYSIQVSAIDYSLNESILSESILSTPDETAIPIVAFSYTLSDVSEGISTWFSSLWLIVAFAVAIPLTFIIATKIKNMFFG